MPATLTVSVCRASATEHLPPREENFPITLARPASTSPRSTSSASLRKNSARYSTLCASPVRQRPGSPHGLTPGMRTRS